jgi:hypothetical protein
MHISYGLVKIISSIPHQPRNGFALAPLLRSDGLGRVLTPPFFACVRIDATASLSANLKVALLKRGLRFCMTASQDRRR